MNKLLSQPLLAAPAVTAGVAVGFLTLGLASYPNSAQAASLSNVSLTKTVNLTAGSWVTNSSSPGNSSSSGANVPATLKLIANLPSVTNADFLSAGTNLPGSSYKLTGATISTSGLTFTINSTATANFGATNPSVLRITSLEGKVGGVTGDSIFGNLLNPSPQSTNSFSNGSPATRQRRATLSNITTTNPTAYSLPDSFDPYADGGNNPGTLIANFTEILRTVNARNYNLALFSAGGNFTVTYDYTLVPRVPEPGTTAAFLGLPVLGFFLKRKQNQSGN